MLAIAAPCHYYAITLMLMMPCRYAARHAALPLRRSALHYAACALLIDAAAYAAGCHAAA